MIDITGQLAEALLAIADIKRTQLQEGNCGQDPTYEGYWAVLNRARDIARSALAAYEASKTDGPCKHPRAEYDSDGLWCPDCDPAPAQGQDIAVRICRRINLESRCGSTKTIDWDRAVEIVQEELAVGQDIEGLVEVAARAMAKTDGLPDILTPAQTNFHMGYYLRQARTALLAVQQKLRGGE